jgi:hypothetical protein
MLHSSATRRTYRLVLSARVATAQEGILAFQRDPIGESEDG